MSNLAQLTITGNIATVTLNRPEKRNSITPEMMTELDSIFGSLDNNVDVRFVIVTGAGDKAFSTGADLKSFASHDRDSARRNWIPSGHRIYKRLAQLPQTTIAVINGDAMGGGLELALACDFKVAVDSARLGLPEVGIGTLPGWGGTGRLVDAIGISRAKYMVLSGQIIDSKTALEWGLLHHVYAATEIEAGLKTLLAQLEKVGPVAQQIGKQLMSTFENKSNAEVLVAFGGALTVTTEDLAEGINSFSEKRPPKFKGK
jgi:enoyl-CoA hydratase/carnithine racemase